MPGSEACAGGLLRPPAARVRGWLRCAHLDDELCLGLLQIGALLVHHQRQQLVLQALG